MFSNQIHMVKMKNEVVKVSKTQSFLSDGLKIDIDTLPVRMEDRMEVVALFFSSEVEDNSLGKVMKPFKGVFIGFPIGLK